MATNISITLNKILGVPESSTIEAVVSDQKSVLLIDQTSTLVLNEAAVAITFNILIENSTIQSTTISLSKFSSKEPSSY